jgi:hypothetical protein
MDGIRKTKATKAEIAALGSFLFFLMSSTD